MRPGMRRFRYSRVSRIPFPFPKLEIPIITDVVREPSSFLVVKSNEPLLLPLLPCTCTCTCTYTGRRERNQSSERNGGIDTRYTRNYNIGFNRGVEPERSVVAEQAG